MNSYFELRSLLIFKGRVPVVVLEFRNRSFGFTPFSFKLGRLLPWEWSFWRLDDFCPSFILSLEEYSLDAGNVAFCFPPSWLFFWYWIQELMIMDSLLSLPIQLFVLCSFALCSYLVTQDGTQREEKAPGGMCVFQPAPSADFIHHMFFSVSFRPKGRNSYGEQRSGKLYLPTDSDDLI